MIGFEEQRKMFELIGKTLKRKVECFVVGGSAMLFYSFSKTATKDVDLVLFSENDREAFAEALERIGFEEFSHPEGEGSAIRLRLRDNIFDLFHRRVVRIMVSDNMVSRAKERVDFGNLLVIVASPEYIVLSKAMTDREGDRKDVIGIMKEANIDWNVIAEECEWQFRNNPDVAFGAYLFDFFEELEDEWGVRVPGEAKRKIIGLYKKQLDELANKRMPGFTQSGASREAKGADIPKHAL